jgi:hypothetical protein
VFGNLEDRKESQERARDELKSILSEFIRENPKGRGSFIKALPLALRNVFYRSYVSKSRASAIKAKCLDCASFERKEVALCEAYTCPLWEHRPYTKKAE